MRVTNEGGSVSEEECVIVHRVVVRQSKEEPFFIKGAEISHSFSSQTSSSSVHLTCLLA